MESLFHYLYVYLYCRLTTFVLTKPKVTKIPAKVQTSKRNTPSSTCSHRLQLRNLPEYPDGIFHRTHLLNHHRTAAVSLTQVAAMGIHGSVCDALPESLALEISTLLVLHEIKHHAPGLEDIFSAPRHLPRRRSVTTRINSSPSSGISPKRSFIRKRNASTSSSRSRPSNSR